MIGTIFNEIIFKPILNLLIFLYTSIGDFGIAVIIITIILRLILFPLNKKTYESQKKLATLQPKIKQIQEKFKDNRQKLAEETMKLYKELGFSPFGLILPLLVQIIILIALYRVIILALNNGFEKYIYGFLPHIEKISFTSFGILDLSKPNIILAFLAAGAQFFVSYYSFKKSEQFKKNIKQSEFSKNFNKQFIFFMPAITLLIGIQFPGILVFYWFVSTILGLLEMHIIYKKILAK